MLRCFRRREKEMEKAAQVTSASRKRKGSSEEPELSTSSIQLKTRRLSAEAPENSASSAANSGNSTCETVEADHALPSCSSSIGSSELENESSKFVDLEEENEAATLGFFVTSAGDSLNCTERREMTPLREAEAESGELESSARPFESNSATEKMPSEAELEEFFAVAEKNLQKKFMDKYNYDIVKDQPLEGRYEWVQVQLSP